VRIARKPSEYLKMIYMDTVSYHSPAVECAIKTIGVDRLVFGSDAPMLLGLKQQAIAVIDELGLAPTDRELILSETAKTLLKL
jgi:aminocarboxymuconate-semialdehyde decarboxylase